MSFGSIGLRLCLGSRFRLQLRFIDGRGRSQLIRDCLGGDGGRGDLRRFDRAPAPAPAPHRARSPPLASARPGSSPAPLSRARASRSSGGSSATIGSGFRRLLRLGWLLSGRLLRLGRGIGPGGLAVELGLGRAPARTAARVAAGIPRHRPGAAWRRARRDRPRGFGIEGFGVRPLPLQGFDGWLVGRQRLKPIGVVRPARSWLLCPVLLQVALGPVRAVFRRVGGRSRGPAGRSAHPPHDSEPSGDEVLSPP